MPKIVFMGTPEFAVPALKSLIGAGHSIPLVISQPDRKKGRGHKVQHTPVKETALEYGIDVFQPESIRTREAIAQLVSLNADYFVVIAYGKILPESILSLPKKACINVHASLLPQWRGAAPIQFSLLNGDEKTGVCTMLMDKGMDTGDLLMVRETQIESSENCGQLSGRLSNLGAELIVETINRFDEITPIQQDHQNATYTRLLKKEDRIIDWQQNSNSIYCQFKAMTPEPGVVTQFRDKRLLIKTMTWTSASEIPNSVKPGEVIALKNDRFDIACGSGIVSILSCQPESKKEVDAQAFINGYQLKTGEIMEEITH